MAKPSAQGGGGHGLQGCDRPVWRDGRHVCGHVANRASHARWAFVADACPYGHAVMVRMNGVVGVAGVLSVLCVLVVSVMLVVSGLQMGRRMQMDSVFGWWCGAGGQSGGAVLGGQWQWHDRARPQLQGQQHQQYLDRPFAHRVMIARTACPLWACAWLLSLFGGGAGLNVRHAGAKNGWLSP